MKYLYKRIKSVRENYVNTLGRLYEYATTFFPKNRLSVMIDAKGGYTYEELKKKCDSISKRLTQFGIGAGDKVAILSQNMPNWTKRCRIEQINQLEIMQGGHGATMASHSIRRESIHRARRIARLINGIDSKDHVAFLNIRKHVEAHAAYVKQHDVIGNDVVGN